MKEIKHTYGTLMVAMDKQGNSYEDWRYPYIGKSGLIQILDLEDGDDLPLILFYRENGAWFHTSSVEEITETEHSLTVSTLNSTYSFLIDEDMFTEKQKIFLLALRHIQN